MPDLFVQIRSAWHDLTIGPHADDVLTRWAAVDPQRFGSFGSLGQIVDAARSQRERDYERRDDLQRGLLALAATDDDARLAMLEALRPGLTLIARAYVARWADEAASMVVAAAIARITTFSPTSSVRPAANIVLGVRNDLFRQRLREDAEVSALDASGAFGIGSMSDAVTPAEELLDLVNDAVAAGRLSTKGARLILLHRVCGVPTREIAEADGIDEASVRKSRNRAEAALVDAVDVEAVA